MTDAIDEQVRGQILGCLEYVKLDLEELKQHSSAVMVGQAIEVIEALSAENARLRGFLSGRPVAHWETGVIDPEGYYAWAKEVDVYLDPSLAYNRQEKPVPYCDAHRKWPCAACGTEHYPACPCPVCQPPNRRYVRV